MAFRSEKAACAAIVAALALAPALFGQQELRYSVLHDHSDWLPPKLAWWPPIKPRAEGSGTLVVTEQAISYQETSRKKDTKPEDVHHGRWSYEDIQQLLVSPQTLTIITYKDRSKFLLGVDQQWEFRLPPGQSFIAVYELLKNRLDQRFVAAFAERDFRPFWVAPVKLLGRIQGSEGTLEVGTDRVVYRTSARNQSRTWRLKDIENISSSGPFELTLTTHERAKSHYGNLKWFNFQLKKALDESQYNLLWRLVNQDKGLDFLRESQATRNAASTSNFNKENERK